jgi:hypothetical protein
MNLDLVTILALTSLLGAIASILLGAYQAYFETQRQGKGETIEDRVSRLTRSLEEATALIGNIESEIQARSDLATQLQEDLDRYNKLVEIKKPEVEAIAQLLRGELQKEGRSTFWKGVLVNFLFFVLGAAASLTIAMLIR